MSNDTDAAPHYDPTITGGASFSHEFWVLVCSSSTPDQDTNDNPAASGHPCFYSVVLGYTVQLDKVLYDPESVLTVLFHYFSCSFLPIRSSSGHFLLLGQMGDHTLICSKCCCHQDSRLHTHKYMYIY